MTDDADAHRREVARLRRLVGPDERSYEQLAADRDGARDAAREAEAELGRARGQLAEQRVQLIRARQDQERFQRWLDARRGLVARVDRARARLPWSRRR